MEQQPNTKLPTTKVATMMIGYLDQSGTSNPTDQTLYKNNNFTITVTRQATGQYFTEVHGEETGKYYLTMFTQSLTEGRRQTLEPQSNTSWLIHNINTGNNTLADTMEIYYIIFITLK